MPTPIQNPVGYAVTRAVGYADGDGSLLPVSAATPLPVTLAAATTPPSPLTGSAAASGVIGPYQPATGRPVMLVLTGTWNGTVRVTRSTDGGATRQPLTAGGAAWAQFTGNCCEAVWEESEAVARLYLDVALTSGTLAYRIAQ